MPHCSTHAHIAWVAHVTPWQMAPLHGVGARTLVLRPFCCPTNMKGVPSMLPMPHTIAGSSRPARSPCSSTNCEHIAGGAIVGEKR
eukprot:43835-Chlamydomonas_euryale.AAC.1